MKIHENTKKPKTRLETGADGPETMCDRGMLVSSPSAALEPRKHVGACRLAQEKPVGAYADRHEDIVDIDALVERPVLAPTVGHGRQSRWRS